MLRRRLKPHNEVSANRILRQNVNLSHWGVNKMQKNIRSLDQIRGRSNQRWTRQTVQVSTAWESWEMHTKSWYDNQKEETTCRSVRYPTKMWRAQVWTGLIWLSIGVSGANTWIGQLIFILHANLMSSLATISFSRTVAYGVTCIFSCYCIS